MLISIIIPCYNVEAYVAECVQSALRQTHPEIEIICVDNNSSDGTYRKLIGLAEQYPGKVRVAQEPRQGAPAARNKGIGLAAGAWLQFLDADDLLMPEKIARQVSLIQQSNPTPDVVVAALQKDFVSGQRRTIPVLTTNIWKALITGLAGSTCSNLYKRSAITEVGGWNESKRSSQEAFLLFELLKHGYRVAYSNAADTLVRERASGSISLQDRGENWERYLQLRLDIQKYLQDQKLLDSDTEVALRQSVFDTIRFIYRFSPQRAISLHANLVKDKFRPVVSLATSGRYLFFYNLLGFGGAQRITSLLRS